MKYKKTSSIIREYTDSYSKLCTESCTVPKELYSQFGVKRGLRDENGTGVLAGLTNISSIQAYEEIDGKKVPCDGRLLYRGYELLTSQEILYKTAGLVLRRLHIFCCSGTSKRNETGRI